MKKKDTVLLLGIFSILILISVQVFIIRGIWKQKDEMFILRYTLRSQEALSFINRRMPGDGFDTVRYILGNYSEQANRQLHAIKDQKELDSKKTEVLDFFTQVLNKEQDLSGLLSAYFEKRGWEKKFNYTIVINRLDMIDDDTVKVYHSQEFDNQLTREKSGKPPITDISGSKILVNWFRMEDNNYRLLFEYYIDFSDKQKMLSQGNLPSHLR